MDIKDIDEILQYGIESFLNNKFDKADMYFTIVLTKDMRNDIARFGVMCIDAMRDGIMEAKDMFSIYIFSPQEQKEVIEAMLNSYQNSEFYSSTIADYIQDILSTYGRDVNDNAHLEGKDKFSSLGSDNDVYDADFILAKVYEKLGDYDKAIDHFARAFKAKPFNDRLKRELIEIVRRKNGK